ncbi:TetR family transcriptional regulator [Prauserella shujinwangii]|uniref:TetR family transcriptional regulator n=1 Tax=Prauserella shujinwangii TaxID=1453103 RepID=A0A2T0M045_9PSEU|nr:TetR/AcrR family transcriptional regulator [Prauserella shujinwangii]PRX49976.1 TetR family transcriptional regulator [Prauserella shujinwangii]
MVGRRSDTRERIQRVALELFAEQGYEKTSLREIAERLDLTKAALYYHFKTKEDIVHSFMSDLASALDDLLEWGRSHRDSAHAREEVLRRFSAVVAGEYAPVLRFMQQNMPAMRELGVKHAFAAKIQELFRLVCAGEDDPATQLRSRLAVVALMLQANPMFAADPETLPPADVALRVALELAAPRD